MKFTRPLPRPRRHPRPRGARRRSRRARHKLIRDITESIALEQARIPGESISLGDIQRRLAELDEQTKKLVSKAAEDGDMASYAPKLKAILDEVSALKEKQACIEKQRQSNAQVMWRIRSTAEALEQAPEEITEWNESIIRQLVDAVKVVSKDKLEIHLRGGAMIEQNMIE